MNSPVKKSVGVFQNRGVCLQAFPRCPTPSLLLFLFCSRLNFRATRIFTRATHSSSFARERLLRRLTYMLLDILVFSIAVYYPTLLRRVQITRETSAKYHTIFVLVPFPRPRERLKTLGTENFGETKTLDNKSLIICILTRPSGSPKYSMTRKNIQRYYTLKCLIRYIYFY